MMSSFSYVALITPKEKISVAMAISESSLLAGALIANLINGPIIDGTSLSTLIYINAGLALLPTIIVFVFFTDITSTSVIKYTWRDMIGFNHLLDAFKCVFKKREGNSRLLLNLSFVAYMCIFATIAGLAANGFLYFVKQIGMSMTEYSVFSGVLSALKGIAGPGILWVVKRWIKPDRTSILMGAFSSMAFGYIIMSIDSIPHNAWFGGLFLCTQIVCFGEIRSFQASLCERDELGKLFAYDALLQLLIQLIAATSFRSLYSGSLAFWPGMFLSISAALIFLGMIVVIFIDKIRLRKLCPATLYELS